MDEIKSKFDFSACVKEKKATSVIMEVTVPSSAFNNETDKVLASFQKRAKISGFRQGKAPLSVIKEKYFEEAKRESLENIVRNTVFDALGQEKIAPLDYPVVDEFNYEVGSDIVYKFTAEFHPSFDVKDYKEIPVKKEVYRVGDANINQHIEIIRKNNAVIITSQAESADKNNLVDVDYEAFNDKGNPMSHLSTKSSVLDLGGNILKEFQDAFIGSKVGDEREIKVAYPDDYLNKEIAGKAITFKAKVNEIKEKKLPDLNDDFAKDMGFVNFDEFKAKVKETIEQKEVSRCNAAVEKSITDYLLEKNVFETPVSLVKKQVDRIIERNRQYLESNRAPKNVIDELIASHLEASKKQGEEYVRLSYILNAVGDTEKLDATDEDMEIAKSGIKNSNPKYTDADIQKVFNENKENIRLSIKEKKVFKFLTDNAKIEETVKDMPLKEAGEIENTQGEEE